MTTSFASLPARVRKAIDPKTRTVDLGLLYPPLREYCPIYRMHPGISPPQAYFLLLDNEEAFYGGAVGGGKSAALLMGALQYVDVPGYRALILRRTFAQLDKGDALIPLSKEWLANTPAKWNEQKHRWTFPSGATLEFGHVENESSKYDYQGAAFHYVGFDELTQFTASIYEYIAFSRQRRRTDMAEIGVPVRVRSTGNPGGVGHGWVRGRFINKRGPGVTFVPAKVRDNPGLDADDYEQRLRKLNPVLASQLLEGDWDAFEGMAYPHFRPDLHLVELRVADIQQRWQRFEGMDYGWDNPTAWLLFAVDYAGNILVCDEFYAAKMLPDEHAREILERREEWWEARPEGKRMAHPAFGDKSSIRETLQTRDRMGDPMVLQDLYDSYGVRLIPGNNRRIAGFQRVAQLLTPDEARAFPVWHERRGEPGSPRLFIDRRRCPNLVEQLETAPIESGENSPLRGEAVDGKWESQYGHAHAALRYGLLSNDPHPSKEPEVELPPQAEALRRYEERLRKRPDLVAI